MNDLNPVLPLAPTWLVENVGTLASHGLGMGLFFFALLLSTGTIYTNCQCLHFLISKTRVILSSYRYYKKRRSSKTVSFLLYREDKFSDMKGA